MGPYITSHFVYGQKTLLSTTGKKGAVAGPRPDSHDLRCCQPSPPQYRGMASRQTSAVPQLLSSVKQGGSEHHTQPKTGSANQSVDPYQPAGAVLETSQQKSVAVMQLVRRYTERYKERGRASTYSYGGCYRLVYFQSIHPCLAFPHASLRDCGHMQCNVALLRSLARSLGYILCAVIFLSGALHTCMYGYAPPI